MASNEEGSGADQKKKTQSTGSSGRHSGIAYDLGEHGIILRLNVEPLSQTEKKKKKEDEERNNPNKQKPGVIVVLDKSGSMGRAVNDIITKVLPKVCTSVSGFFFLVIERWLFIRVYTRNHRWD